MAYPVGVVTRTLTAGGSIEVESGDELVIAGKIVASHGLIWTATGERMPTLGGDVVRVPAGEQLGFTPPVTDQSGYRDEATGYLIDVSTEGSHTHTYTLTLWYERGGRQVGPIREWEGVILPTGDGSPVDLDTLLPVGTQAGGVVLVPDTWDARVAAAEAAAVAASAAVADVGEAVSTGIATFTSAARQSVLNRGGLARYEDALRTKACPVITVIGNSIAWGVGSDGSSATTYGFYETYRQQAWPVQVRKRLALQFQRPCEHWVGLTTAWGYSTLAGGASGSQTLGPFGTMAANGTRGGVTLPDGSATVTVDSSITGAFTDIDVFYWGTAAGVGPGYDPTIVIDGATKHTGGTVSAEGLSVVTVTGLADAAHTVVVTGVAPSVFVAGMVMRRSSGVVVNRIAVPGARASDAYPSSQVGTWTTAQINRVVDSAVLHGYSDLVIIEFTANEVYQQTPLATYSAALTALIDRATDGGACVLLLGDPAVVGEEEYAIKGSDYRDVMIGLVGEHVAYADFNAAVFGDRDTAQASGLWSASGSVHPSLEGHRRMADFIANEILPGASI